MKVTLSPDLRINIEDMDGDEMTALIDMIQGASLEHRRIFYPVLKALTKTPLDKLERKTSF